MVIGGPSFYNSKESSTFNRLVLYLIHFLSKSSPLFMIELLSKELKKIADLSDADLVLMENSMMALYIPKGEYFLKAGQISNHIGYIESGLMIYYRIVDGVEIPCDFASETEWVAYLKSFSTNTPSDMYIQALEDTKLLTLSGEKMNEVFAIQPKLMTLRNYYTEQSFIKNTEQTFNLTALSAKERYYKFMHEHPKLLNRVPQYQIAAYLGIKPQSLSRIRKGVSFLNKCE